MPKCPVCAYKEGHAETCPYSESDEPHELKKLPAWECPKCGRIYSPFQLECKKCNDALEKKVHE